jgi:UDP-glucose 4-epimerase
VNIARGEEVQILRLARLVQELVAPVPIRHHDPRPGDVRRHCADVARARSLLGFEATIGIEDGLRSYVEWVKATPEAFAAPGEVVNWGLAASPV